MLCACSGEQFKFEEAPPRSPESLATRDFSAASCLSSRTPTGDWKSRLEEIQVDEAESTLKEALSLNYEEARALLGRLEYLRGNFDASLQVFHGIDIRTLKPKMVEAISERSKQRRLRPRGELVALSPNVMSMHSVSLLLEAILLKAKSLEHLGRHIEAATECTTVLDIVEEALPNGLSGGIGEDCKLEEMLHKALELLPLVWTKAGLLGEAIAAYRRVLVKPWNLDSQKLAQVQKELASLLLYGAVETRIPSHLLPSGSATPQSNMEEAILLLLVLMEKMACGDIKRDDEVMDHLMYAFSLTGQFELLAEHVEQALPGVYNRAERWYILALCYSAAGQDEATLNLLEKVCGFSESKHQMHVPSCLFGAKLCSQYPKHATAGIKFATKITHLASHGNQHVIAQAHRFLGVCCSNAARTSASDTERVMLQQESLNSLNKAALMEPKDSEILYSLSVENTLQRNLDVAFGCAMMYAEMVSKQSVDGLKLLAFVVSAEQRFKDAETIVELAMDDAGKMDHFELLRLKAVLQIAQEQPKQAIDTYRILLALIQTQRDLQAEKEQPDFSASEAQKERNLEIAAWQDLASIYTDLRSWPDAKICINKAMLMELNCPRNWHMTGQLLEAQSQYREALVAFSFALTVEPDYVPSIVSTARILLKFGDRSRTIAKSFLMNALRLDSTNHEAWLNLGKISRMEGSLQQAADFFQAAYELQSSAPAPGFSLVGCQCLMNGVMRCFKERYFSIASSSLRC